ncbi:MAG: protein translocase subunit SecD [Candidatus Peribacteraceae bacterium]|nr:protein translocase subunit SecD [Candidatus Peribacteraceae bacterium]
MSQNRPYLWPSVTALIGLLLLITALPQQWKEWAPGFLRSPSLHLGLDLVGGTQLDFRISEEEINAQRARLEKSLADMQGAGSPDEAEKLRAQLASIEEQQTNLVEAIRIVIERRINALGVSEATITPSYIGNEKHLLVECPGVVDTQECINVVGKTIQLEFKEEFTEPTEEFKATVTAKADAAYRRVSSRQSTLQKEGQDLGSQLGMDYRESHLFFRDTLPEGLQSLWGGKPGTVAKLNGSVHMTAEGADGQTQEKDVPGIFVAEILGPLTQTGRLVNDAPTAFSILAETETGASYAYREDTLLDDKANQRVAGALRSMEPGELKTVELTDGTARVLFLRFLEKGQEEADVSHILVAFGGATDAAATVTRTKEEAQRRAEELKARIDGGASFEDVARTESDGSSTKAQGGRIGAVTRGSWPPSFEDAAFKAKQGAVSGPVETQYGYHLIRLNAPVKTLPDKASFDDLVLTGADAGARADTLLNRLRNGEVTTQQQAQPLRTLFFSLEPTGWKDTALDGKHFRSAAVTVDPVTNIPVVQISFDDEGGRLFQELTKANVGKRIAIFVGGQLVSAPEVQQEISGGIAVITGSQDFNEAKTLAQDLNTGAIPAPIHLVGQYTVEATLGAAALQTSLQAALVGILVLMLYMVFMYRALGVVSAVALSLYAILLSAILKLPLLLVTGNYIVLTLAGMAGIILSIGMAVDANVLVFERIKEELRKGKMVKTAVETSFRHAWPAIRDSNVSTIITCGILFVIGTSIIRGFAITLATGVPLSMLTAVVVTRWLLRKLAATPLADRSSLFVRLQKPDRPTSAAPDVLA